MTVLNNLNKKYAFPNATPNGDSDNDLQLDVGNSTDGESTSEEPTSTTRRYAQMRLKPRMKFDDAPVMRKHGGRRRLRRYQNSTLLQTLNEEEYDYYAWDIYESKETPLSRLVEDPIALQYWNEFIEKSEEEQRKIIGNRRSKTYTNIDINYKKDKPFMRISSKIRRILKIKRNLPLETVKSFESDVIQFFKNSPEEKYVKYPNTSFDRLLTHAVAQFHCLFSFSEWENERRKVEIFNLMENWSPAECSLHELVSKLKS